VIYLCNKNQQDAVFYCQFISIINLYMFRAGLLLIIRRYFSVYTAVGMCRVFMLAGYCWYLLHCHTKFDQNSQLFGALFPKATVN
jgi:hypothetical protein